MVLRQKSFGQSFRTPTFNGALSDFIAAEQFTALSADNAIYEFTFDANIMYFGVFRTSGTFGGTENFAIYLDTDSRNTPTSRNGSGTVVPLGFKTSVAGATKSQSTAKMDCSTLKRFICKTIC